MCNVANDTLLLYIIGHIQTLFTARKRSLRRLCFYTCLSVILFFCSQRGSTWAGTPQAGSSPGMFTPSSYTTWAGTPPGRYTPPPGQVHPQAGTPPRQVHPPGKYTPRSSACWEIRATSEQYASYWNAFFSCQ